MFYPGKRGLPCKPSKILSHEPRLLRENQVLFNEVANTEMPFHSIFNSAEEITSSRHVTINRLLQAQSALD